MKQLDEGAIMETLRFLAGNKHPIEFKLTAFEMYLLLSAAQLTVTHPGLHDPMRNHLRAVGDRLQEAIAPYVDAEFREFEERGWHREFDQ